MKAKIVLSSILFLSMCSFGQETSGRKIDESKSNGFTKSEKVEKEVQQPEETTTKIPQPAHLYPTSKSPDKGQTVNSTNRKLDNSKKELCVELGLDPVTSTSLDVKMAMRELYLNNSEKFNELNSKYFNKKNGDISEIKRSTYNALSNERKALIDSHPERYKIID